MNKKGQFIIHLKFLKFLDQKPIADELVSTQVPDFSFSPGENKK